WERAVAGWRELQSDEGAAFDQSIEIDATKLEPMITYGTNPGMGMPIGARVPDPDAVSDPSRKNALRKALDYMDLKPGEPLLGHSVDVVFIGSCTNSRISDLRAAADVLRGRRVDPRLRVLVVPGSQAIRRAAEAEGLDRIFRDAGAEWREPGCSM